MNLGISSTQVNTWKRIKSQHIAAAAGVALAVSALAGGYTLRNDSSAPSAPQVSVPASVSQRAPQAETFIYIAGSQAEAAELRQAFATAGSETGDNSLRSVFVADSAEAEAQLQVLQGELMQAGSGAGTIVDLRAAPLPAFDSRAEYVQVLTPEAELLSAGMSPWQADSRAEYVQVVTPEAELLSSGMNPWQATAAAVQAEYVEVVTPEAEILSTGINPFQATAHGPEYVEVLTPEAEMLSAGMNLP